MIFSIRIFVEHPGFEHAGEIADIVAALLSPRIEPTFEMRRKSWLIKLSLREGSPWGIESTIRYRLRHLRNPFAREVVVVVRVDSS